MTNSRFLRTLILSAALPLVSFGALAQDADTAAARAPLETYIKAQATGEGDYIRKAFHADARIMWARDGKLTVLSTEEFAKRFNGKPPEDEAKRSRRIEQFEVVGTAAFGKIVLDYPTVTFTDYMQLLKTDGEWKIISKTFNVQQKVAAK